MGRGWAAVTAPYTPPTHDHMYEVAMWSHRIFPLVAAGENVNLSNFLKRLVSLVRSLKLHYLSTWRVPPYVAYLMPVVAV